jgi:glutamate/tyrosine decarboxylase-like PLP-dependent enzyme
VEQPDWKGALGEAFEHAVAHLDALPDRPIGASATLPELRSALGGPLPDGPRDARRVVAELASAAAPGVVASGSGRFFGFVVGGAAPAALAADWLTAAWDQNAGLYVLGPAAAVVEEVAGAWLAELLGLPDDASVGFVTGAQMANVTALAAALTEVLSRHGWDLATAGLWGAPPVRVLAGDERHGTIDRALRFLGVGTGAVVPVASDGQGRMRADALERALDGVTGPAIVCAQVGNVNTGAVDPVGEICDVAHRHGA